MKHVHQMYRCKNVMVTSEGEVKVAITTFGSTLMREAQLISKNNFAKKVKGRLVGASSGSLSSVLLLPDRRRLVWAYFRSVVPCNCFIGLGPIHDRAVGVIRLRFRYHLYPCVLCDLHDAPLPLLGEMWVTWPFRYVFKPLSSIMSTITDVKCVLSEKAFDAFCEKFHIPEEVHPVLTNRGNTMHERPAGKIGLYTSRHYTLDEKTYPLFSNKDGEVAPDRGESELDASVDKLFDEGGSGAQSGQGDSASVGGEQGMNIQPVTETTDVVVEDVIPLQPRRLKKRKTIVSDVGGPSHPSKELREDHKTPSGVFVGGESSRHYTLDEKTYPLFSNKDGEDMDIFAFIHTSDPTKPRRLKKRKTIVSDVGGPSHPSKELREDHETPSGVSVGGESRGEPIPTMHFLTSSVSAMSELEGEIHTDFVTRLNLRTISALQSDFLAGGIRTVINPDSNLQKTYVPQWNMTNGSRLDDGGVCCEMVDEFVPLMFFTSVREMEHNQLFTEFNVGAARQMSLNAEVMMRVEYNIREKRKLKSVIEEKDQLLKAIDEEIDNLKAQLLLKEAKVEKAICLHAEASKLETAKKSLRDEVNSLNERNTIFEKERNALNMKVTDLEAVVVSKECD
nr:hypothetical protein [Tanacetum cinerariifolium]